jgi:hypothetical protein
MPVVQSTGARHWLNVISTVPAKGQLWFSTFTGGFNIGKFILFCKQLLHDADGPVFLIVAGASRAQGQMGSGLSWTPSTGSCACLCCPATPRG